ncbi:amino acid adenylation domain-containing protein, partial [Streptomyces longwoodensis]|uniref:amino acid adenylation domain-containing protein n=1 Tax=Streptomyces longwoodensis TaxID=68231 RepID=UPI0033D7556D
MSAPAAGVRRPLSPAQAGVWYAQRLDPANPVFHMGGYLDILGPADPDLLRATVAALVAEDETTRLRFTEADGVPQQYFAAEADFTPHLYDVSGDPDPAAAAMRAMRADLESPPDLEHGPLFTHLLFRLGDEHFIWYHRVHHLVHDGYSASIQRRRAAEIYTALVTGSDPGTPYGSYAVLLDEQAAYAGSSAQRRDRAYWARLMEGAEPPGGPAASATPAATADAAAHGSTPDGTVRQGPAAGIVRDVSEVDRSLRDALDGFAERSRVTWQQALLAVAVLHRGLWAGGSDVLLGLPVPGRVTPGSHRTPGMAANTVPLRCGIDPRESCEDLAARVAAQSLRAQWHQRYADTDLLRDLGWPVRGRSRFGPVVNIVPLDERTTFAGLPAVSHLLSTGGTADDLTLSVTIGDGGGLRFDVTLDAAQAGSVDLAAYRGAFVQLLSSVVTGPPGRTVAELDVCDPQERARVLERWNDTAAPPEHRSVPAVFASQVARTPDATAIIDGDEHLTYQDLDTRANQLAHHLRATGTRRGDIIGVLLERGTHLATALLATLKAGAAYAVLDPDFPDERLTTTTTDAHISTVITTTQHQHRLREHITAHTVDTLNLSQQPVSSPACTTTPQDAACLMFTSGSTGRPKAILTPHHAITGTLHHQTYTPLGPTHTTLQCSPTSWDAFSLEFWGALLHGATTVLHPGQRPEPDTIHHLTHTHPITTLQTSSTLFNYLVDHHPTTFQHLHTAFTGGEPASSTHVARIQERYPALRVVNGYGPAESMGFTTTYEIPRGGTTGAGVPIGRPIVNKQAYVLDTALRPVPPGVTGELYLTGTGLAHGYHNQPTLTATRFIPNPYGPPGTRLYRTGDLAHWTTHGHLNYDGRTDTQIKIRGFRIEPTDIEHTLLKHPHITQAALTPTTNPTGEPCLAAYLTTPPGTDLDASDVKRWLRERMPDHMVPAAVMVLDQLPFTPNGKLDHRALPAPTFAVKEQGRPPRTPEEVTLCELFGEVLNTGRPVTLDDDFFDLGGHSLLAARLTHRANHTLGTHLTIRDVFQAPTVADLTTRITGQETGARTGPTFVAGSGRPARVPLSEAQRRLWLQASVDGPGTAYNVPLFVRLDGAVDQEALRAAVRDVVRRHEVLRTVIAQEEGDAEPWQRVLDADGPDALAFEVAVSSEERIEEDLRAAAAHVFELTRRPPMRVTLFELAAGERYVLSLVLHHIATDGQSVRPLFDDLTEAYRARRAGEAPAWGPLPAQYADWAHWQRQTLAESGALEDDLAYWREALADLPEELGLQLDRPRPARAGHLGGAVPVEFGRDLMDGVRELARRERCTPFMVLHAALVATLTRMGAGTDLPIGSPVAGRSAEELRGLVGFFVNTLVLRVDASGDPSFRELLGRVRGADLDAFAHQDAPFDRVLEAVNPVRSLSRHPLFQVCLALEDGTDCAVELPGTARAYARVVDTPTAKYDWEFLLRDDPVAGLAGAVLYSAEIFEPATAQRMVRAFRTVLERVLAEPDGALSAVDVLDAEERVWVVERWNDTAAPPEHRSVPAVFTAQVARTPDATAIIDGDEHLTYQDLDTRANQLAHHLRATGTRRGDIIGVLLERGT